MTDDSDEPQTSAAALLQELQTFGWRPFQDEPDPRPLPEPRRAGGAVADIFDALVLTLAETRLEPDLDDLLWGQVNVFQRKIERVQRELDDNEAAQQRSQRDQDGSEVRSVELERLLAQGLSLIERRNAFEAFRDIAADLYETHLGQPWRSRSGSRVNHATMTAAMIDSRDFIAAAAGRLLLICSALRSSHEVPPTDCTYFGMTERSYGWWATLEASSRWSRCYRSMRPQGEERSRPAMRGTDWRA